jgi:PKD repeat protein
MTSRSRSRLAVLAALTLCAGCTIQQTEIPSVTGPSELALSLDVTAVPDLMTRNGVDQSTITVTARDPNGAPRAGVQFRIDTLVGGFPQDFGTLAARSIFSGADGRATVVYTAPPPPPLGAGNIVDRVTILAAVVGSNYQTSNSRTAEVRLVLPSVISAPGSPVAQFIFFPTTPKVGTLAMFDGRSSTAEAGRSIVSYTWYWGDGETGTGSVEDHDYLVAGTYGVTLVVQDDLGRQGSTTQNITVVP